MTEIEITEADVSCCFLPADEAEVVAKGVIIHSPLLLNHKAKLRTA